jgi:hypothetical protein
MRNLDSERHSERRASVDQVASHDLLVGGDPTILSLSVNHKFRSWPHRLQLRQQRIAGDEVVSAWNCPIDASLCQSIIPCMVEPSPHEVVVVGCPIL